jgi:hypothetical protein
MLAVKYRERFGCFHLLGLFQMLAGFLTGHGSPPRFDCPLGHSAPYMQTLRQSPQVGRDGTSPLLSFLRIRETPRRHVSER